MPVLLKDDAMKGEEAVVRGGVSMRRTMICVDQSYWPFLDFPYMFL
jgi:hypothetical protein